MAAEVDFFCSQHFASTAVDELGDAIEPPPHATIGMSGGSTGASTFVISLLRGMSERENIQFFYYFSNSKFDIAGETTKTELHSKETARDESSQRRPRRVKKLEKIRKKRRKKSIRCSSTVGRSGGR